VGVAVNVTLVPAQIVVAVAPMLALVGKFGFTITATDDVAAHPFTSVTVTVYVPEAAIVTLTMKGFCDVDVKLLGPVQLYDVPPEAVRFNVAPAHCGELLPELAAGNELMVTVVVEVAAHPFPSVTVTV